MTKRLQFYASFAAHRHTLLQSLTEPPLNFSSNPAPSTWPRSVLLLIAGLFTWVWLAALGGRGLFSPDEGRYAEIAREMLARGDWILPHLNAYPYFEKPPLQYWATATAFQWFGTHDWSARLWTGLCGLLTVFACAWTGQVLFDRQRGIVAALVLGSSLLWYYLGHYATLDMGVAAMLSGAVFAFIYAQHDRASLNAQRIGMYVAWACAALAVLSKGLIGIVLPLGTLAAYVLWQRDWARLKKLHLRWGLVIFFCMTAPWFIAASVQHAQFAQFFFVHEHWTRFVTTSHGRSAPGWYFIPVILIGLAPWTFALPGALARALHRTTTQFQPQRFLLTWIVVVFSFFSLSGSKLPSYVLPIFPAAALLIADWLCVSRRRRIFWICASTAFAAACLYAVAEPWLASDSNPAHVAAFMPWMHPATLALTLCAGLAAGFAWWAKPAIAQTLLAVGGVAFVQLLLAGYTALAPVYSARDVVAQMTAQPSPPAASDTLYLVDTFDHAFLFYANRTGIMVGYRDELVQPIQWAPGAYLPSVSAFERVWQNEHNAIALMRPSMYTELQARGLPMRELARDVRRVVVSRQ